MQTLRKIGNCEDILRLKITGSNELDAVPKIKSYVYLAPAVFLIGVLNHLVHSVSFRTETAGHTKLPRGLSGE